MPEKIKSSKSNMKLRNGKTYEHNKKKYVSSSDDDSTWIDEDDDYDDYDQEGDEDDDDDDYDDDEENGEFDIKEFRELLAELYPSKYSIENAKNTITTKNTKNFAKNAKNTIINKKLKTSETNVTNEKIEKVKKTEDKNCKEMKSEKSKSVNRKKNKKEDKKKNNEDDDDEDDDDGDDEDEEGSRGRSVCSGGWMLNLRTISAITFSLAAYTGFISLAFIDAGRQKDGTSGTESLKCAAPAFVASWIVEKGVEDSEDENG